jgi:HNH endonuclease
MWAIVRFCQTNSLTQNGLFALAAQKYKEGVTSPETVRVFEKIRSGICLYNGLFKLIDCWIEESGGRKVFRFKLQLAGIGEKDRPAVALTALEDDRLIPSLVKLEVWKRDRGRCLKCGASSGLHFDHIIPYSKGGSSKDPSNIQILCASHTLAKHDRIE